MLCRSAVPHPTPNISTAFLHRFDPHDRYSGDAVPVGSSIHSRNRVKAVSKEPKGTKLTLETHIHVVGQERPALVYDLMLIYMG